MPVFEKHWTKLKNGFSVAKHLRMKVIWLGLRIFANEDDKERTGFADSLLFVSHNFDLLPFVREDEVTFLLI